MGQTDGKGREMCMVIIECVAGAVFFGVVFMYCGRELIRDTRRWERGTRLGTTLMWAAVIAVAYIVYVNV
jgi:hypothetical protein